ncbi:MAG: polysaccharide biosynthesis protein [Lawsonibacter sp.]|nr:polysaccharide biosynthesis protein [Lawsonibacter sp.]
MALRGSSGPTQKQNTFFGGAVILAAGIFIVKIIGMFYKIPLINIIGAQGNSDFTNAYSIYAVLLTISTAGLPVAVSKLVSEANAVDRRGQVRRIFLLSLILFLALGSISFLVMYFRADALAALMHDSRAASGIRSLAPAVICVGCLSAFRGYTQGHNNMLPTSVSQIIEALCKLVVGLGLAYLLMRGGAGEDEAAAGAITGVTVGTIVALSYMILAFVLQDRRDNRPIHDTPDSTRSILLKLLSIAIPITLSASMVGIVSVIDTSLIQGQLQRVLLEQPDSWLIYRDYVDFAPLEEAIAVWKGELAAGAEATMAALSQQVDLALASQRAGEALSASDTAALSLHGLLESVSRILYGNYSGALNIYNLPTSLMAAITASVIPTVSGALARRNRREATRVSSSALRITALLACPMGVGLFVLGTPIIQLLFPSLTAEIAGPLLSRLGLATLFVCMMLVCNSVLQAYGFVNLPVIVMLIGGIVEIAVNYMLVAVPSVGIYGAPFGNVFCYGLSLVLDLILIARVIPNRPRYLPILWKPLAAAILMGGGAWAVHGLLARFLTGIRFFSAEVLGPTGEPVRSAAGKIVRELTRTGQGIAVMGAIGLAVAVYAALVVTLKAISREDLSLMPKGDKIARMLRL